MTDATEAGASGSEDKLNAAQLWFVGGTAIIFAVTLFVVLFIPLLAALVVLNSYSGWPLLEIEMSNSEAEPGAAAEAQLVPVHFLTVMPTPTPVLALSSAPMPLPTRSLLKEQVVTVAIQVGRGAGSELQKSVRLLPLRQAQASPLRVAVMDDAPQELAKSLAIRLESLTIPAVTAKPPVKPVSVAAVPQEPYPPAASANSYHLIPLEGPRESRPAADHGDLNLKLRDPQPIQADLNLIDINGSGLDPDAPNLGAIFKPDFVRAYTVHDWDWGCNCQGKLLQEEHAVLLGIRTTPGTPIFIPPRKQNVYAGKYYATLLYASEDSLTFVYTRAGSVAAGYTIHYLGLRTDPNLLALFRQSQGNKLPGLTLDTPVGIATAELIVAIRDNGSFLDVRSRRDWWK